ncbi:MAG TPA: nuclease-related domain-containing protein [Bacillales bacterium]|nr:nuclease-related domain-containing protein [Bacillales bacterium]
MGQLIKLQDCVSRYEQDVYTYPSRFVRLKKQQWERTKANWENEGMDTSNLTLSISKEWVEEEKEKPLLFRKLKGIFQKNQDAEQSLEQQDNFIKSIEEPLQFSPTFDYKPQSVDDLKRQFLDQLYRFQLKWASSTLTEKSDFHSKFFYEENLKFFLQRFPDTFLVLYQPVFLLKKAPVEAEVIMFTPTDVWCITFLEEENSAVFVGSTERFWLKRGQKEEKKVLNPLLSLNRTERIIRNIFKLHEIELPIHKLIISRNGYIDYPNAPFDIKFAEGRNFEQWFQSMRSLKSPLKHTQLKGAECLLQYCKTTSIRRLEWETPEER